LDLYAQAVSADQQEAHKKVIHMVLPVQFSKKLEGKRYCNRVEIRVLDALGAWGARNQTCRNQLRALKSRVSARQDSNLRPMP
jgi:hypothetical protein